MGWPRGAAPEKGGSMQWWEARKGACFYVLATCVCARADVTHYNILGGRRSQHQPSFEVQYYKTLVSRDVLKKMNGNQSFVIVFEVD